MNFVDPTGHAQVAAGDGGPAREVNLVPGDGKVPNPWNQAITVNADAMREKHGELRDVQPIGDGLFIRIWNDGTIDFVSSDTGESFQPKQVETHEYTLGEVAALRLMRLAAFAGMGGVISKAYLPQNSRAVGVVAGAATGIAFDLFSDLAVPIPSAGDAMHTVTMPDGTTRIFWTQSSELTGGRTFK